MYSSVADMTDRFGEAELVQLSTPKGEPMETVRAERVEQALLDASGLIDSYLRRRYQVPVATPPAEIVHACARLARYDLAFGGDTAPSEQMRLARKETIAWLEGIASGAVTLDGALPIGVASFARASDRDRTASLYPGGGYGGPGTGCWP